MMCPQAHLEQLTSAMHFGMMDIPGDEADLSSLEDSWDGIGLREWLGREIPGWS